MHKVTTGHSKFESNIPNNSLPELEWLTNNSFYTWTFENQFEARGRGKWKW